MARLRGHIAVNVYTTQNFNKYFLAIVYTNIYMNIHRNVNKVKRREAKAPTMVFRLKRPLAEFLRHEAEKRNRTMTSIVEELLSYRKNFKTWPPEGM